MPFLDELDVRVLPGSKYLVLSPFRYQCGDGVIRVDKGFKTDFATIPRPFRPFITGHDNTRKPAVIHDYLYRHGYGTRKGADQIFLQAMKEAGVKWFKREAIYRAVRIGAGGGWRGRPE